ncbi:MAG: hypothetical protein FJX51_07235, partial [Alphaproteobacteria bacterium]|nr:hypothetical protein [Alphaproteobacteria bacterium]
MAARFPHLFSPFSFAGLTFKNRIFSSGHDTSLTQGAVNDALVAYHEARARGGAALIIVEVAGVHESALYHTSTLRADTDDCVPGYARLARAVHGFDCRLFGQLFHAGREVLAGADGSIPAALSASDTPNERFHLVPRAMTGAEVRNLVACYGGAAGRLAEAGLDGIEIVASHGYLPAQFLNPRINRRADEYGGTVENRIRFLVEIAAAARVRLDGRILGLRISGAERDVPDGLSAEETAEICARLTPYFDYFNVTVGSVTTLGSSMHSVPGMNLEPGYAAPLARTIKTRIGKPVFTAGRINHPQLAETIIASGTADMVAMTRGMLSDPELANKARAGKVDEIRLRPGLRGPHPWRLFRVVHPVSRERARTRLRHPRSGDVAQARPRRGRRAGGTQGRVRRGAARASRHALRARGAPGRPGAARRETSRPHGVRRPRGKPDRRSPARGRGTRNRGRDRRGARSRARARRRHPRHRGRAPRAH